MREVIYSPKHGEISVMDVPSPQAEPRQVLVRTRASLVSAGTERMLIQFAEKNLLEKARSRPDLVQQAINKARRDGLLAACEAVRNRLDRPAPLGYSSAGTIVGIGAAITDLAPGDRVACAGAGYATHAEMVSVPRNLVARIPEPLPPRSEPISFEEAAFATLGAIAMHALRLANPQMGETLGVIGLGAVGLLAVQLAAVAGCTVYGMDPDEERCRMAETLGCAAASANEAAFESLVAARTESIGVDAVIVAAATSSDDPVRLAGAVARARGRVVAVGAVGTRVPRNLYYQKELNFGISRSYGPGRYDREYEEQGRDYPIEYVRWTENRNLKAFLNLLAGGRVHVRSLISHRFPIGDAVRAYDLVLGRTKASFLGVILTNERETVKAPSAPPVLPQPARSTTIASPQIGLLGPGNFALGVLLPAIRKAGSAQLVGVCAARGMSAQYAANKFGFRYATTDLNEILSDPQINTIVIATPHRLHAQQVLAALAAGKHVFCEKPLCVSEAELAEVIRGYDELEGTKPHLVLGFNRRFAPMSRILKEALGGRSGQPIVMHYRVNAGPAPTQGWFRDEEQGGRILGEVCHFVDFMSFLAGAPPACVFARRPVSRHDPRDDTAMIALEFSDGSLGTISYVASGDTAFSKERIEVFGGGSVGIIEDFRRLDIMRDGLRKKMISRLRQDKGHRAEWEAFAAGLRTGVPSIPFADIVASTLATLRIIESLRKRQEMPVELENFFADSLTLHPQAGAAERAREVRSSTAM